MEARIARTGVQTYPNGAEYRPGSTVFDPDSMASFRGVAITVGHRAFVDAKNVKEISVGFVRDVRRDGIYLAAELVIVDAQTIADLESGALKEWSAGYTCENGPGGVFDGVRCVSTQLDVRANHVAALPPGDARCGSSCSVTMMRRAS